jgi:succinyl-CoA synthetase alpha subunit
MKLLTRLPKQGLGISTAVGIGWRSYHRNNLPKEAIELFMNDSNTDAIVMIGEIGWRHGS